jgi:hypothetical protein
MPTSLIDAKYNDQIKGGKCLVKVPKGFSLDEEKALAFIKKWGAQNSERLDFPADCFSLRFSKIEHGWFSFCAVRMDERTSTSYARLTPNILQVLFNEVIIPNLQEILKADNVVTSTKTYTHRGQFDGPEFRRSTKVAIAKFAETHHEFVYMSVGFTKGPDGLSITSTFPEATPEIIDEIMALLPLFEVVGSADSVSDVTDGKRPYTAASCRGKPRQTSSGGVIASSGGGGAVPFEGPPATSIDGGSASSGGDNASSGGVIAWSGVVPWKGPTETSIDGGSASSGGDNASSGGVNASSKNVTAVPWVGPPTPLPTPLPGDLFRCEKALYFCDQALIQEKAKNRMLEAEVERLKAAEVERLKAAAEAERLKSSQFSLC